MNVVPEYSTSYQVAVPRSLCSGFHGSGDENGRLLIALTFNKLLVKENLGEKKNRIGGRSRVGS